MKFIECHCSDCRTDFKITVKRNVSVDMGFICPVCESKAGVSCKKIDENGDV